MQWLRSSIPSFQSLVHPLHEFFERVYAHVGKRTKRSVGLILLENLGWTPSLTAVFEACKSAIVSRIKLVHCDDSKRLCIYTDASDTQWSGIVTQVPYSDLSLPHAEQRHEPLAFHSVRFSATKLSWSTIEKEAYAVLASVGQAHWLATCADGFDLYTDHNNLIFIFDPTTLMPDIALGAVRKVLRWVVRMSAYKYVCIHIRGEDNLWADLLTRWDIPLTIRRLVSIPPLRTTFRDFAWPDTTSIRASQNAYEASRPPTTVLRDDLWCLSPDGPVWVPDEDDDLQLLLAIISHTGAPSHRGRLATEQSLAPHYSWSTLSADIRLFVQSCIHCISTTGGVRPFLVHLAQLFTAQKLNSLLQFYYIEICLNPTGEKCILMLRDYHSGYSWLYPSGTMSAGTASHTILDWTTAFVVPSQLMSDGPSHFKNETVRLLTKGLRTRHHFTLAYFPRSNGAVKRLGKELLRVARARLS